MRFLRLRAKALQRAATGLPGARKDGMEKGFYSPNRDLGTNNYLLWLFSNSLSKFQQSFFQYPMLKISLPDGSSIELFNNVKESVLMII